MDIGTAGFLSTCAVTAGGIMLKYISIVAAAKSAGGNGKCPLHADVVKRFTDGDKLMKELQDDSRVTRRLVIAIAGHLNIPIGNLKSELQDMMGGD